ncbi:MAG: hypothetical protein N2Z80_00200 [Hydrogenothermaceae bacterium]|nr:hypothetical protein [Hydrogenothermaceae bacterium]
MEKLKHSFEKRQKRLLENGSAKDILRIIEKERVDILLAGDRNMYTALKAKYPFLDVNQERAYPFAGYEGIVNMAKHLVNTLYSPVWKYVRGQ